MTFSENDIPNLNGKIIIVTGGNSGIGKQTVAVLASKGAKVYLAARSAEKYHKAVDEIHESHPESTYGQIEFLQLDLSTAASALAAANYFKSKENTLHILFNNAGIMGTPTGSKSSDGYELQWATNVFGPFVLTYHLLPILEATAASSPPGTVRIINTASNGAAQAPKKGIPLADPTLGIGAGPLASYGSSKIGTILVTRQLARRYPQILSLAPHPGSIRTELFRDMNIPRPVRWLLNRVLFKPVQYGALTQLYAGTFPSMDSSMNGSYLVPLAKFESQLPHVQASDDVFGEKVWNWNLDAMKKAGVF